MEFLIFLICLIILIFFIYWGIYNYLVEVKNNVSTAYANIDVQLKKRYDLIPNLVNSVREYMKYEKETLEKLISLRTKAVSNKTQSGERLELDKEISQTIGSLMVSVENYPDLKANKNFLHLQETLNEVELNISASGIISNHSFVNVKSEQSYTSNKLFSMWISPLKFPLEKVIFPLPFLLPFLNSPS